MRRLRNLNVLVYYDGPEVFSATDQVGATYLCLLVEGDLGEKYLCVPVSHERLLDFASGRIDLLSVFRDTETDDIFVAEADPADSETFLLQAIEPSAVPAKWLPDPGFFLEHELASSTVVEEAHQRGRAIIHCRLEPPEARYEPRIHAERLGQALRVLQRVVSHAFHRSLRDLDAGTRQAIGRLEYHQLEVFSFSPGSFTLHMQTAAPADMLGYAPIEKALRAIDRLTESMEDPDLVVSQVAEYGGYFASSFRDLLQFVAVSDTPLSYEWSMPERNDFTKRTITGEQAREVYLRLVERSEIGSEEKRLVGTVNKVDEKFGSWRLVLDQEEYSGRSEQGVSLAGVVIGNQYEFVCDERLEEERGTGKEKSVLYLKAYSHL